MTPLPNGWQRARWDFPSPIELVNPRNEDNTATITFTSDDNNVVIAPQYQMAVGGDIGLQEIVVTIPSNEARLAIDSLTVTIDTQDVEGPDTFDSQSTFVLETLDLSVEDEVQMTLGALELGGTSARQRLDLFAELQEVLQGLDPEDEAFATAFVDVLRRHEGEKWIGDAGYTMTLRDFDLVSDDASASLGALDLSLSAEDLDAPSADLALIVNAQDFASPSVPPAFISVVPTNLRLDLSAADAPIEALSDEMYRVLGEAPSDEELYGPKGRRAGMGFSPDDMSDMDPMAFLGIMMQSEVEVLLNDFLVEAPIGYVAAQGTIQPDPQAAMQATADINLQIAGLPDMIAFAQSMGGDSAQAARFASLLAAMGRDATDAEGVAIKEFDLDLTPEGQVLLNGNDLSAMLGMFQ